MSQCLTFSERRRRDETPGRVEQLLNSVTTYHVGVLALVFAWGVLANWVAAPAVSAVLPAFFYTVWALLHLLFPPVVWAGKIIQYRAYKARSDRWELTGWQMQRTGDSVICIMCTTTVFAFMAAGDTFVSLMTVGMSGCAAGMAAVDFIKAHKRSRAIKGRGE